MILFGAMALIRKYITPQEGHRPLDYEDSESSCFPNRRVRLQSGFLADHPCYKLAWRKEMEPGLLDTPTGGLMPPLMSLRRRRMEMMTFYITLPKSTHTHTLQQPCP